MPALDPRTAQQQLAAMRRSEAETEVEWKRLFTGDLGLVETYSQRWAVSKQAVGEAYRKLGLLKRSSFLKSLCGPWKNAVVQSIADAPRKPYQSGLQRVPFRVSSRSLEDQSIGYVLLSTFELYGKYKLPPKILAEWLGYIDDGLYLHAEWLFSGAIDSGDSEVLDVLIRTVQGSHDFAAISRTAIRALLGCKERAAWIAVENSLLQAQRAEGLRQLILESVDEANPDVFRRFVRLLVEHNLTRFSSAVRAMMVWLPGLWPEGDTRSPEALLGRLLEFLDNTVLQPDPDSPSDIYLRLWSLAYLDAEAALKAAEPLISSAKPEVRRAVGRLSASIGLSRAIPLYKRILADPDTTVASTVVRVLHDFDSPLHREHDVASLALKVALVWPKDPPQGAVKRDDLWDLVLRTTPSNETALLVPYVKEMNAEARWIVGDRIRHIEDFATRRKLALDLLSDSSHHVRGAAVRALAEKAIQPEEAVGVETLLSRKSSSLRKAAIEVLSKQPAEHVLASGRRLVGSKDKLQNEAGKELLGMAIFGKLQPEANRLLGHADSKGGEAKQVSSAPPVIPSLTNGLGLIKPQDLQFFSKPEPTGAALITSAAVALLEALDEFIHEHRNLQVRYEAHEWWQQNDMDGADSRPLTTALLGELSANFVQPRVRASYGDDRARFDAADLFEAWLDARPPGQEDEDGHALVRAYLASLLIWRKAGYNATSTVPQELRGRLGSVPRYQRAILVLMPWLLRYQNKSRMSVLVKMLADQVAESADESYTIAVEYNIPREISWREAPQLRYLWRVLGSEMLTGEKMSAKECVLAFQIARFQDEPHGLAGRSSEEQAIAYFRDLRVKNSRGLTGKPEEIRVPKPPRFPCNLFVVAQAFDAGLCSEAEVYDQLCATKLGTRFENLEAAMNPRFRRLASREFLDCVDRFVAHAVEIESRRGELPTEATPMIHVIGFGLHLEQLRQVIRTGVPLVRRGSYSLDRAAVFSDVIVDAWPSPDETPEICAAAFRQDKIKTERLLEVAMLAPQWAAAVEIALGWDGLEGAVWWMVAHAKADYWRVSQRVQGLWLGAVSERTALSRKDFEDGAVDTVWFNRFAYKLDDKQWKLIDKTVKFVSSGRGHSRSRLFYQAMKGEVSVSELETRILVKRQPDAVRALGLVPLGQDREEDVKQRYAILQKFLETSRQFGSLRQSTEKLAFHVGLDNLARTAGYPDPLRLTWALEAKEVEDLRDGGKTVQVGEYEVNLSFDALGEPQTTVFKNGARLASVPPAIKSNADVNGLVGRRAGLRKQAQRVRISLEQSMQRGDEFEPEELAKLAEHPGLCPILGNLLFIGKNAAGFLDDSHRIAGETGLVRIAHPYDLLQRGDWPDWQRCVFNEGRIQPFKQVFRELYVLTEQEKGAVDCTRYGGHQLNPRHTLGVLSKRGWVFRQEEGVTRTIHELRLTARLDFDESFFTPADIEGLTLKSLHFTKSGEFAKVRLEDVPPKAFSETMRDLDLIVSVASSAGADPEASESTVEMRANVVRETAALLKLSNVSFLTNHVVVQGNLAEYSVHLGSGIVHQRAKGQLVIVAVRQPQRGRIFLPFLDEDPRTAEIVSKVLLLAKDCEIKDPTIVSQIVS